MKQTIEEAAREHQAYFEPCCSSNDESINFSREERESVEIGRYLQSYKSFIEGAEWQQKQSSWINVNERLPEYFEKVFVLFEYKGKPMIQTGAYSDEISNWKFGDSKILAWMSIPPFDEILEVNKENNSDNEEIIKTSEVNN